MPEEFPSPQAAYPAHSHHPSFPLLQPQPAQLSQIHGAILGFWPSQFTFHQPALGSSGAGAVCCPGPGAVSEVWLVAQRNGISSSHLPRDEGYRIPEQFRLEGTSKLISFQPCCHGREPSTSPGSSNPQPTQQ